MRKTIAVFAALTVLAAVSISGCRNKYEEVDLGGIHTTPAETMAKETTAAETTAAEEETKETEKADSNASEALSVRSHIATYKDNKVTIEYPILANLRDDTLEEEINGILKEKALLLLETNEIDSEKDEVNISCEIISLDRSKGIFTFDGYMNPEGAAYPTDLFYTVSIDLSKGELQRLGDYADPYTMAEYIMSEECTLKKSADDKAVKEYFADMDKNALWESLKTCDFSATDKEHYPETFSYVNQGIIYISVPVLHALGDYAIVEFHPEGK